MSITITDRLDHTMSLRDIDEIVQALAHERDAIRWLSNKVGRAEFKEEWPAYAWPGGYTLVYFCDDGEDLCSACMNDPDNPVHFAGDEVTGSPATSRRRRRSWPDGWKVLDVYLAEENDREPGEQIACAHCGAVIYTEPEESADTDASWIIGNADGDWWSNDLGWVERQAMATTFSSEERDAFALPIDGHWVRA